MNIQHLVPTMSYAQIEHIIKPFRFSIRETPEPLHLHKYGLPLRKFRRKGDLCDYLNFKIRERKN